MGQLKTTCNASEKGNLKKSIEVNQFDENLSFSEIGK